MPQSRSLPLLIQLVQMVGPLIPTYNRIEPVNVGGMELLSCRCRRTDRSREVRDAAPT